MRIHLDSSLDPYYHVALEYYYLYQDTQIETSPVLIIYKNKPSVVLGNFQNPWLETNLNYCKLNNIEVVRRFSGGGCVYNDLGNLNFCLISAKSQMSKRKLTEILVDFFHVKKLSVIVGEKSDLLLNQKKLSGSAFRETKNRSLHHCTLLFNSNLEHLKHSLQSPLKNIAIQTKALPSRPASVANLIHNQLPNAWKNLDELIEDFYNHQKLQNNLVEKINECFDLDTTPWKSWEQVFAKTPDFSISLENFKFLIQKGLLTKVSHEDVLIQDLQIELPADPDTFAKNLNLRHEQLQWLLNFGLLKNSN